MLNKKAAMFGLDARIALAIFGALSVITGAALYSAIQNAKVVSIITELDNLDKAYSAYLLDTGQESPIVDKVYMNMENLIENPSIAGWKGPYTTFKKTGSSHVLSGADGSFFIIHALDETWTDPYNTASTICVSGKDCSVYAGRTGLTEDMAKAIDIYIDGTSDYFAGKVRIYVPADPTNTHVFIKKRNSLIKL